MTDFHIYDLAKDADEVFHAALVKEFGEAAAGDMRYQPDQWPAHVRACADAFQKAADAWRDEMATMRRGRKPCDGGLDPSVFYRIND